MTSHLMLEKRKSLHEFAFQFEPFTLPLNSYQSSDTLLSLIGFHEKGCWLLSMAYLLSIKGGGTLLLIKEPL